MLKFFIFILVFSAANLFLFQILPYIIERLSRLQVKRVDNAKKELDEMFVPVAKKPLLLFYILSLVGLGVAALVIFRNPLAIVASVFLGLFLPTIITKQIHLRRKEKFRHQLMDSLMLLSSSLKGGLSLIQAIEVLVEDMPAPISQEFSLVLRENKMGVPLEASLMKLSVKMRIEELEMMVNSILVAREVGGDLTKVFSRLSSTIRDRRKLEEHIKTLTLQGRMQAVIMSVLPIVFVWWVISFNPRHFDVMLQSELGRTLLIVCVVLQVVGMVLIRQFSKLRS